MIFFPRACLGWLQLWSHASLVGLLLVVQAETNIADIQMSKYPLSLGGYSLTQNLASNVVSVDWVDSLKGAYIFGEVQDNHTLYGSNNPGLLQSNEFETTPFLAHLNLEDASNLRAITFAEKTSATSPPLYSSHLKPLFLRAGVLDELVSTANSIETIQKKYLAVTFSRQWEQDTKQLVTFVDPEEVFGG